MKKSLFALALVGSGLAAQAQAPAPAPKSPKYVATLTQNLAVLDTATRAATFQRLADTFERIAAAEKTQWLPYYYAGYCALRVSRYERDHNLLDGKIDRAEALTQSANALNPKNADIYCLNALITFARINVDFMGRGPKYSAQAQETLATAQQLDPTNPRPYLLIGESKYNTPPQFGGDKKAACQYFEKANNLFATAPADPDPLVPHWGKSDAARYVARCNRPPAAAASSAPAGAATATARPVNP